MMNRAVMAEPGYAMVDGKLLDICRVTHPPSYGSPENREYSRAGSQFMYIVGTSVDLASA